MSRLVWLVVIVGGLVLSLFAADLVPKTRQLVAFQSEGLRPNDSCPMLRRFRAKGEINPHTGRRYPLVLLYSFEGSGNTWTRTLLEQATGMFVVNLGRCGRCGPRYSIGSVKSAGESSVFSCVRAPQVCTQAPCTKTERCIGWDCTGKVSETVLLWR